MPEEEGDDRNILEKVVDKVRKTVRSGDLEEALTNEAAAMPAAGGDFNLAPTGTGTSAGVPPGAGAAAAGSLTDDVPVGRADEAENEPK
jgi:hypothetical protein